MEAPGFIKTIDKPDMGVGEVVLNRIRIEGHWKIDKTDNTKATFMGIIGSIDYDDYGSIYDDPEREVTITFDWNNSHWSGTIPYNDKNGENKTLIVYTDAEQSVWVFESEDRVAYTPASNYDDYVPQICELLNIESK